MQYNLIWQHVQIKNAEFRQETLHLITTQEAILNHTSFNNSIDNLSNFWIEYLFVYSLSLNYSVQH
jgi:hypothetical protein